MKWKNGKWTGSKPPFGYLKDEEHGCWKIDPVAGKYVRMIFDKAMEGCNTSQICYYMNEQKVPTPGKYNQMNGLLRQGNYKMPDKEVVWDTGMIRTILGRFEYTGALVMGRRHTVAVGSKVTRKTGKRQQRVLESELKKLKNERIHQYEAYAEGVLSREKYITVKKQLTEKIEKIQSEQKALASVIIEEERYRSRIRTAVQQLEVQIERGKLTKEIIDTMIDTVYVYDKKRIEVILRFDDVLQKVISEYMEGAKGA